MGSPNSDLVDPRLPRLGQAITGAALGLGFVFQWAPVIPLVALVLAGASILGRRANLYAHLFRWVKRVFRLGSPAYLEEAAPPRFSNTVGFLFTATASLAYYGFGSEIVAWTLSLIVSALALLAAVTGLCVGCEIYVLARRFATRGRVAHRVTVQLTEG
jgi:Domain of unknown function (DUF4395)